MERLRRTFALFAFAFWLPALSADAAVVQALSADELLARSSVVCLARVESASARFRGDRIVTDVTAECERAVKGATDGDAIGWVFEGGIVDDVGMRVPGEPTFRAGDRAIVFLSEAAGDLRVTGMAQGALFVGTAGGVETVAPRAAGATFVRRGLTGRMEPTAPWLASPRSLAEVMTDLERRATR